MASSQTDWTIEGMNDHLAIQTKILDRFEKETGNTIVDPNNTASFLMEAFASEHANTVRAIEDTVRPAIYPARATTTEELYKHLSDYDYVGIFASPAETTLIMTIDRDHILGNAVEYTDDDGVTYHKAVIPNTAKFTIGDHSFGLYYPIEIRCNTTTGRVYIVYDTSTINPMYSLSSNTLEYDIKEVDGQNLIYLKIPVYQFEVTVVEDVVVAGSGYRRSIPYTNKFYAIRAQASVLQNPGHADNVDDEWAMQELKLCVSGQSYDPETPTLVFTPDLENKTVELNLPYVYFSKGLINGSVITEIYTTEGEIDYTVPEDTEELCTLDLFDRLSLEDPVTPYVEPFRQMPSLEVLPGATEVIGGNNGMSLDDLRKNVVRNTLTSKTLQTPDDIDAYFEKQNYKSTVLQDGVTNRIFLAHAAVKNSDDEIISAGAIGTKFDFRADSLKHYHTIVASTKSNVFTILPSTIYKFNKDSGVCIPLTDTERADLNALTPTEVVSEFNDNIYTISPYHLQVDVSSSYPTTITYDMDDIEIDSQQFIGDRNSNNFQLILNNVQFETEQDGSNGVANRYRFTFRVSRSGLDDVESLIEIGSGEGHKNIRVFCGLKNVDGVYYFGEAEFLKREDTYDYFVLTISSTYQFSQVDNEHSVTLDLGSASDQVANSSLFYLTSEMRVILTINGDIGNMSDPDVIDSVTSSHGIETDYTTSKALDDPESFYALTEYKLVCQFGSVVNELDQRINLTYSEMQYLRYGYTKFKVLEQPQYARDTNNELLVTKDETTGKYSLTEQYPAGKLTCMTKTILETVVLNRQTFANYIGCHYQDGDEVKEITADKEDDLINTDLAIIDSPCVPRFTVVDAADSSIGDTILVGQYELVRAQDATDGLAHPGDKWVNTRPDRKLEYDTPEYDENGDVKYDNDGNVVTKAVTELNWVNCFELMDVIKFIDERKRVRTLAQFEDETPVAGRFTLVTGYEYDQYSSNQVILGELIPGKDYCKIFYCPGTEYGNICLAAVQDEATFKNITLDDDPSVRSGYVYVATAKQESTEAERTCVKQEFVNFMVTKTLESGAVVPDIGQKDAKIYDDNGNLIGTYWENYCQRFPWDLTSGWYLLTDDDMTVDDDFEMELDDVRLHKYIEHTNMQYDLDDDGNLQEDPGHERYIQYLISMLQLDAKPTKATYNIQRDLYPKTVLTTLRTHYENLGRARDEMFTNTRLYFEPFQSIGYSAFKIDSDKTEDVQLDITVSLRLHVDKSITQDETLMDSMKYRMIQIIDEKLETGYLNLSDVSRTIMNELSDSISYIDILGINGDPTIQTLRCLDNGVKPHLSHKLVLLEDNITLDLQRGLNLEYVVDE